MGRHWTLLACALLLSGSAAFADDEAGEVDANLLARLCHPLKNLRSEAEEELAARDDAAAVLATLRASPKGGVRASAWRVYRLRPELVEAEVAIRALDDPDPRVGSTAASALVTAAGETTPRSSSWIPSGCLGPRAQRVLTPALAAALERAPEGRLPSFAFRLGEGAVPSFVAISHDPAVHIEVRRSAAGLLGKMGTAEARRGLLALVPKEVLRDRAAVFDILRDVPLTAEEKDELYTRLRDSGLDGQRIGWRAVIRHSMHWRERTAFLRLVDTHPPNDLRGVESLRDWLTDAVTQRRSSPPFLITVATALLALGEPSDIEIRWIVQCCEAPWRPRWRGRAEELGQLLVLLERYEDRSDLHEALGELLAEREFLSDDESVVWESNLPRSVEAWARYLLGTDETAVLEEMATRLIVGEGEEPTWPARRLGAELWRRLGTPPADLVRRLLDDGDAVMRRHALRWRRALPEAEAADAVVKGTADADLGVLLSAAEAAGPELDPQVLERVLDAAVEGSRGQRGTAWRILMGAVQARPEPPSALVATPPGRDTPLDARIRAAHLARTHLRPR